MGVPAIAEFFADRPLRRDGSIVVPGFVESFGPPSSDDFEPTPEFVTMQVQSVLTTGTIPAYGGGTVEVQAATLSVHSDGPMAIELAGAVRLGIEKSGTELSSELAATVRR
jgi:lactam utilization protein B